MEIRMSCKYFIYSFCANAVSLCTRWWVFGCETSPLVSDLYPMRLIRFKTPPRHDYHWRGRTDRNIGLHFENCHRNLRATYLKRLLRRIPAHAADYSHWLRGWDSGDYPLENGRGVGLVLWSFKRGRDEPAYSTNPFGKIVYTCYTRNSHPLHGGRDTRKEHAACYLEVNLCRRRYTPNPLNTPAMGGPSTSLKSIRLSRGRTGPTISILRP